MTNIKELRKQQKKTQKDLAEYLGINTVSYLGYESGRTEPNIDRLIKLADYYHVSLDYLVGREWRDEIGYLSPVQRDCVEDIKKLTEINLFKATAYIKGLIAGQESKER